MQRLHYLLKRCLRFRRVNARNTRQNEGNWTAFDCCIVLTIRQTWHGRKAWIPADCGQMRQFTTSAQAWYSEKRSALGQFEHQRIFSLTSGFFGPNLLNNAVLTQRIPWNSIPTVPCMAYVPVLSTLISANIGPLSYWLTLSTSVTIEKLHSW